MSMHVNWRYQRDSLSEYNRDVKIAVNRVLRQTARDIRDTAEELAPKKTGCMAAGIYVSAMQFNDYGTRVSNARSIRPNVGILPQEVPSAPNEIIVAGAVDYTVWVHDGTSRTPAHPFITQAVQQHQGAFYEKMAMAMNWIIPSDGR